MPRMLNNNGTTKPPNGDKPTKDTKTKESKNMRSKSKVVTLCLGVPTLAVTYGGRFRKEDYDGFVFDNRYNVYDCDDYKLEPIGARSASLPDLPEYPLFKVYTACIISCLRFFLSA